MTHANSYIRHVIDAFEWRLRIQRVANRLSVGAIVIGLCCLLLGLAESYDFNVAAYLMLVALCGLLVTAAVTLSQRIPAADVAVLIDRRFALQERVQTVHEQEYTRESSVLRALRCQTESLLASNDIERGVVLIDAPVKARIILAGALVIVGALLATVIQRDVTWVDTPENMQPRSGLKGEWMAHRDSMDKSAGSQYPHVSERQKGKHKGAQQNEMPRSHSRNGTNASAGAKEARKQAPLSKGEQDGGHDNTQEVSNSAEVNRGGNGDEWTSAHSPTQSQGERARNGAAKVTDSAENRRRAGRSLLRKDLTMRDAILAEPGTRAIAIDPAERESKAWEVGDEGHDEPASGESNRAPADARGRESDLEGGAHPAGESVGRPKGSIGATDSLPISASRKWKAPEKLAASERNNRFAGGRQRTDSPPHHDGPDWLGGPEDLGFQQTGSGVGESKSQSSGEPGMGHSPNLQGQKSGELAVPAETFAILPSATRAGISRSSALASPGHSGLTNRDDILQHEAQYGEYARVNEEPITFEGIGLSARETVMRYFAPSQ